MPLSRIEIKTRLGAPSLFFDPIFFVFVFVLCFVSVLRFVSTLLLVGAVAEILMSGRRLGAQNFKALPIRFWNNKLSWLS